MSAARSPHQPIPPSPPRLSRAHDSLRALDAAGRDARAELETVALAGLQLGGVTLDGSTWQDVTATDSSLAGAQLEHSVLADVLLERCDLANAQARGSSFARVRLDQTRALGLGLAEAHLRDVVFTGCQLDLASLRFARLDCVTFRDCQLREADLSSARLSSVVFEQCDLGRADLSKATFARCELRGCTLDGVRGLTTLAGVSMSWADIVALTPLLAGAFGVHVLEG